MSNKKVKRPMNAYMLFSKEKRAEIIQQKPELKFKVVEVAQLIDNYCQEMTSEEKDKYVKMAETNRKIYESEIQK
ncbi:HMG-box domain-containing protein [Spiroplasma endosymbiont of Lariophagus distinguendus]|uniref:HMG-box domain-containing protein n=1 Tax=Spiroplasma endosymbiont of Lariophagus distinguendus TaxID=2935082 RepID=UPI00207ACD19|nr:HMG-box domain-containing protein [Spiroplasma endosymbiont of Lariophagus distinguendus]